MRFVAMLAVLLAMVLPVSAQSRAQAFTDECPPESDRWEVAITYDDPRTPVAADSYSEIACSETEAILRSAEIDKDGFDLPTQVGHRHVAHGAIRAVDLWQLDLTALAR